MHSSVTIDAPAKINLRLRVLAREETGFHALETIFCSLALSDTVRVEPGAPGVSLLVDGAIDTGPVEENLVVRAARRFHAEIGEEPAVRILLTKHIPSAAGLGGGSSDAAATLLALNALHGDVLDAAVLMQCGSEIGSDVSYFLCGSTLALGWSRGERLLALPPLPTRPVLVAHPGIPLPTARAFRGIAERRGGEYRPTSHAMRLDQLRSWDAVAGLAGNDFGEPAQETIPMLATGLATLREHGARVALLAGSGSAIFGVFETEDPLTAAERLLRDSGFSCWATTTLESPPAPRGEISGAGPDRRPGSRHG